MMSTWELVFQIVLTAVGLLGGMAIGVTLIRAFIMRIIADESAYDIFIEGSSKVWTIASVMTIAILIASSYWLDSMPYEVKQYQCVAFEDGKYCNDELKVAYKDDEGNLHLASIKSSSDRAALEDGSVPYIEIKGRELGLLSDYEWVCHINIG